MRLPINLNLALVIALSMPMSVQAAEWSAEPKISLRTGYNDNIRLTAAKHDSVWETALSPSVKFGVAQENQGLSGDAGFAIRRFAGGSGRESNDLLDREDFHLNTDAWHTTLRDSFKANLNYTRDSTLDYDGNGNVTDDRATRERFTLGPSWTRTLNELTRLDLSYQFTNVDYTDDSSANLVGYDYHAASASLIRQLSPRIQGTLAANFSRYSPARFSDSETLSLQAGLTTNFSETLTASFLVGRRETTSDSFVDTGFCIGAIPGATYPSCTGGRRVTTGTTNREVETNAAVFSASLSQQLETGTLSASVSRSSSPSSNGELLDATRLILAGDYKLTETLSSSLKIEFTENETIVGQAVVPSQDTEEFFRVTPRVSWRWRREWSFAGEYQYARNDDVNQPKATRNAVYVTVSYRPPKRSISR